MLLFPFYLKESDMDFETLSTLYKVKGNRSQFINLDKREVAEHGNGTNSLIDDLEKIPGIHDAFCDADFDDCVYFNLHKEFDNQNTRRQILETIEEHLEKADEWVASKAERSTVVE